MLKDAFFAERAFFHCGYHKTKCRRGNWLLEKDPAFQILSRWTRCGVSVQHHRNSATFVWPGKDSDVALAAKLERAAAPIVLLLQRALTHLPRQCAVRKQSRFRNALRLVNCNSRFGMSKVMAAVATERSHFAWAQAAVALCKAFCVQWCSINI